MRVMPEVDLAMECGIYGIKSPSGDLYVGSSRHICSRIKNHMGQLSYGQHTNRKLQVAYDTHGGHLEFQTLVVCAEADLGFYEQSIIDGLRPNLNLSKRAGRSAAVGRRNCTVCGNPRHGGNSLCRKHLLAKQGAEDPQGHHKHLVEQYFLVDVSLKQDVPE